MPSGYSAKCAACKSARRVEIDQRLLGGDSARSVSAWLATHEERISFSGLSNHKREHCVDIPEAIQERIAAVEAVHAEAVSKGLNRVQELERNAEVMIELRDAAVSALRSQLDMPDKSLVSLVTRAAAEVRQSIVAVQTALGEVEDGNDFVLRWEDDNASDSPADTL